MSEQPIVPTVPEDWKAPAWLTFPKYSKREVMWLCERLQDSNHELLQSLFRLREELRKHDERNTH